jgi:general secretion pathway protein L
MLNGALETLRAFAVWWLRQISTLLQTGMKPRTRDALIVVLERLELPLAGIVLRREARRVRSLGRLEELGPAPSDLPVLLRLPPNSVLTRAVTLPLAAERDVAAALNFEMDRLTPFSADELFWSIGSVMRDQARALLRMTLLIVPRAPLEPVLELLGRRQLRPEALEAEGIRVALQRTAARQRRRFAWPALCACLAVACLVLPLLRQQIAIERAQAMVLARAPAAAAAQRLRAELVADTAGRIEVAAARRRGDPLQVLAALTGVLPDDTWLSDLALKDGSLTMDGQSGNAARLIGLLAAVPALKDPSFTAPVTRTSDNKADLFSLRAETAQ